jgi:hydroxyacylglutathione hydrolase
LEIVEGIHRADKASGNIAHSNIYVVINDEELTIIDTGTHGNAKKIVAYIQEIGFKPQDVSTIVITHHHLDHTGSLKELKVLTGSKVAVSKSDADYVSGKQPYPKPKNLLMRAAPLFMKTEPVDVDILLEEGTRIGGLLVVETPGHTEGSIMLYDKKRKALFAGDTLRFDGQKISGGPKQYSWNETKEKESIEKISKLDFDVLLPGHGDFLKGNASSLVKEYLQSKK